MQHFLPDAARIGFTGWQPTAPTEQPMRVTVAFVLLWVPAALARAADFDGAPAASCRAAIAAAEAETHIPDAFLDAIGRVESGRPVAGMGISPWPWTINAAGVGHFYATKGEAVAAARAFLNGGVKSIDVGCLQVSLLYHPDAFVSLNDAFDPGLNASFAAKFLLSLFQRERSWPRAAAAYHSQTPVLGQDYQQKVLAAWALPDGEQAGPAASSAQSTPHAVIAPAAGENAAPAPVAGFNSSLHLPGKPAAAPSGRSLAAYRAFPVLLAHGVSPGFKVRLGPRVN